MTLRELPIPRPIERAYLMDEGIMGEIVSLGAHASLIRYNDRGMEYEVYVLNEDFLIIEGGW